MIIKEEIDNWKQFFNSIKKHLIPHSHEELRQMKYEKGETFAFYDLDDYGLVLTKYDNRYLIYLGSEQQFQQKARLANEIFSKEDFGKFKNWALEIGINPKYFQ